MEGLLPYLILDLLMVMTSCLIMRRQLVFLHPFTMYLFFHLVVISLRAWQLYLGSPPMYAENYRLENIQEHEFIRAIWMADIALFVFCVGAWAGQFVLFSSNIRQQTTYLKMERHLVQKVCWFCLPIGLVLFTAIKLGVKLPETSYFTAFSQWFICCLLVLIYVYGFRAKFTIPAAIYLCLVAIQGYHRTQLVLPVIFILSIILIRQNRKWPNKLTVVIVLIGALVFPQLKFFGQAISNGDYTKAFVHLVTPFSEKEEGKEKSSLLFLDQYAGALSMRDEKDKYYYGSTYVAMLTLPIPRLIWPNKPGLGDHTIEVSTKTRPYDLEGRIITYIGESYFNFSYLGLLIVPSLLAFLLSRWFNIARRYPKDSISMCMWVMVYGSLIQVFRDGLSSFVTFTIMINTPLFFVALWSYINNKIKGTSK